MENPAIMVRSCWVGFLNSTSKPLNSLMQSLSSRPRTRCPSTWVDSDTEVEREVSALQRTRVVPHADAAQHVRGENRVRMRPQSKVDGGDDEPRLRVREDDRGAQTPTLAVA